MNISALLPSSTLNQANPLQSANQPQNSEFQQLTQALQTGNMTTAQQAFSALTSSSTGSGLQSVQLTQDLNALGSALQSGNLSGAQSAYSSVQQNLQSSNPGAAHHHRMHGGGGSHSLTSGFPDSTDPSQSDAFQPVNLTA